MAKTLHPVDTGWAWVIMMGSFGVNFILVGYMRSFGVLFVAFQERYAYSSALVSFVTGVQMVAFCIVSLLVMNVFLKRIHVRTSCILGVIIMSTSLVVCNTVKNSVFLILTLGLTFGIGQGLVVYPSIFTVAEFFLHRRAIAITIASCGASIGSMVFPIITNTLLDYYGLQGTLLIIAGILLNILLFVSLFTPPSDYGFADEEKETSDMSQREKDQLLLTEDGNAEMMISCPDDNKEIIDSMVPTLSVVLTAAPAAGEDENENDFLQNDDPKSTYYKRELSNNSKNLSVYDDRRAFAEDENQEHQIACMSMSENNGTRNHCNNNQCNTNQRQKNRSLLSLRSTSNSNSEFYHIQSITCVNNGIHALASSTVSWPKDKQSCHLSTPDVFRSKKFWALLPYFLGAAVGSGVPAVFIPPLVKERGLGDDVGAYFLTISAVMDMIGRLVPGFILHKGLMSPSSLSFIPQSIGCVLYSITFVLHSYTDLLILSLIYGMIGSCYFATQTLVVIEVLGMPYLASAMGYYALASGFSMGISFPIGGFLHDITGTYSASFIYFASMFLLGIVSMVMVQIFKRREVISRSQDVKVN